MIDIKRVIELEQDLTPGRSERQARADMRMALTMAVLAAPTEEAGTGADVDVHDGWWVMVPDSGEYRVVRVGGDTP